MKRVLRAIVALFCLCSFVPSAPALAVDTGQIVGTVINVATNKPVAGAEVIAQSPSGTFRATSDARGQFSIVNVPTDTYAVRVGDNLKLQFQPQIFYGVTVLPGQPYHIAAQLGALRTIATVRGRSATSPFQPNNLRGSYNLGSNEIKQFVGKDFNVSGQQLLATLPGITVDRNGTPLIRGGFNFEEAYEVEGIDYTEPNTSLINRFQNFGNSDLINGVGNVEIIPGGGDATHGNTGTGLISITIKRGTKVPFTNVDFEEGHGGDVSQYAIEDSRWLDPKGAFSNYFSLVHNYTRGQYGPYGTDPGSIGASPITSNPNEDSNINAHSGYLYTTAFYNPANTTTDDWLDNFVFKFGPNQVRSLQFFIEDQHLLEKLDYGGLANGQNFTGVNVATPFPPGVNFGTNPFASIFGSTSLANKALTSVYPAFPYGVPGQAIPYADSINSPFSAFKLDFRTPTDPNGSLETRFYRTFNSQTEYLAQQGIYSSDNGGIRTGVQLDLSHVFGGGKNVVQAGGKYEFAHPYGTTTDTVNYFPAISGLGSNNGQLQISTTSQLDLIPDFISPQPTLFGTDTNGNTIVTGGTPGCVGNVQSSGPPPVYTPPSETGSAYCGYLSRFFANGKVPSIPAEVEVPTANEQQYGLYLQDTYAPNARLHLLGGLRLDGYNFLLPNDPQNPPALNGLAHQRLFEPHVGASYQLTRSDAVLANYGRTLSIPLPTFLGLDIDRSAYDAFNDIPSYDNSKGPFNPGRTLATQANVCGPGVPQTVRQNGISTTIVQGTQPCASYADELYWLYRNYRFGLQSLFKFPLKGASFTNWDFTYEHQFADGTAFRLTPFTRRGYDVVEQSRTLLGWDPSSEVPILSPLIYSNLGLQEANGFEFYVTRPPRLGGTGFLSHLSYQLSATYVNQIGNDPPGTFLPTASTVLGELYPSPNLARLQGTLGITYRSPGGLRISPILTYRSGYPYGAGVVEALDYGSVNNPVFVPLTNAITNGLVPCAGSTCLPATSGTTVSNGAVDPQNPGTITSPHIIATRGTEPLSGSAGDLTSGGALNANLYIEFQQKNKVTYGLALTNLFDQTADVPVVNYTSNLIPVATGRFFPGLPLQPPGQAASSQTHTSPTAVGSSVSPYIVYPNQTPFQARFYVQFPL